MVLLLGLVSADEGPVVSASATINKYFKFLLSLCILCWIEQKETNLLRDSLVGYSIVEEPITQSLAVRVQGCYPQNDWLLSIEY